MLPYEGFGRVWQEGWRARDDVSLGFEIGHFMFWNFGRWDLEPEVRLVSTLEWDELL